MLNFEKIQNRKTVIGGVRGKVRVRLVGFDVKEDRNGNNNYQFKLELLDYEGMTKQYNCGESFYNGVISNIGAQLGFEAHTQQSDVEVLTQASTGEFNIWIDEDNIVYFYDREEYLAQRAVTEDAVEL